MKFTSVLLSLLVCFTLSAKIIEKASLEKDPMFTKRKAEIEKMVTFVKKAAADAKSSKDATLKEFSKTKAENGKYQDGQLYIYAYDFSGNVLAHGAKAILIGKNLMKLKDKKGNLMIQELSDVAKKGSGYVEFYWENPKDKKQVQRKLGYVEKVDDNCWIGSGIYFGE